MLIDFSTNATLLELGTLTPPPPPSLVFASAALGKYFGLYKPQQQLKVQQQEAEAASRQDAARLGAMNAKLTKDFNRVNAIALDLGTQVFML